MGFKLTLEIPDVFESRKRGSESRFRDSKTENGHFRVPFKKNSGTDPKLFFDVLSGWGGQVQPQKWWKIVGTAPFPSPRPGNIKVWRAIFRIF